MAALVAVMIMVSVGTFDWHSTQPQTLRRMPKSETTGVVATVLVTVSTLNLAIGVVVGVLVAMTLFARRVAHLTETDRELVEDEHGGRRSTRSPASCSSDPAMTSTRSSTTSTTPSVSSSTFRLHTSGTPRPWPRSKLSPPSTSARGRRSRSSASTRPAPSATAASPANFPLTETGRRTRSGHRWPAGFAAPFERGSACSNRGHLLAPSRPDAHPASMPHRGRWRRSLAVTLWNRRRSAPVEVACDLDRYFCSRS